MEAVPLPPLRCALSRVPLLHASGSYFRLHSSLRPMFGFVLAYALLCIRRYACVSPVRRRASDIVRGVSRACALRCGCVFQGSGVYFCGSVWTENMF